MPHPTLQHLTTTRVLELLHMELMGPMQVESIGGRRYVYVVVDDFSIYTWVNVIKEKPDDADDAPAYDVQNEVPEVIKEAESNTEVSSSEQTY
ncbi:gag-pol polyprotein, partial [Trifolium medium]|nr:gag-pol polyprotein [Trifolium medium]